MHVLNETAEYRCPRRLRPGCRLQAARPYVQAMLDNPSGWIALSPTPKLAGRSPDPRHPASGRCQEPG